MPIYPNGTPLLRVRVGVPVAEATVHELLVIRPDGQSVVWPAEKDPASGSDVLKYQVQVGELIIKPGTYLVQPRLVLPTWRDLCKPDSFTVSKPGT